MSFFQKEFERGERVLGVGVETYDYLKAAGLSASDYNFNESSDNFNSATLNFAALKKMIDEFGLGIAGVINSLPVSTPISTAKNLAEAGENMSIVGKSATELIEKISQLDKDSFLLSSVLEFQTNIDTMALNLKSAEKNLDNVNINYVPENLKRNVEEMFQNAVEAYNKLPDAATVELIFQPLAAGYGEHLFNEIVRDIISADIAVFDTSDLNPNVMLEMGVALTWGVRVLPIKEENCPEPPSDISGQTWAKYSGSGSEFVDSGHKNKLFRMVERAARKKGRI